MQVFFWGGAGVWCSLEALRRRRRLGARGVEGALIGSLPSHQYVQVVDVVVLLGDPQRQHLLVEEQSAQTLLAGLPLLLQLPLAQRLLLQLPLLRSLLEGQREGGGGSGAESDQSLRVPTARPATR